MSGHRTRTHVVSHDLARARARSYPPFIIGPKHITSMVSSLHHTALPSLTACCPSGLFLSHAVTFHLIPQCSQHLPLHDVCIYFQPLSRVYCTTITACIAAIIMNDHVDVSHNSPPIHHITRLILVLPSLRHSYFCSRCIAKMTAAR